MPRVKEFDVDVALLKAVRLFWKQGYEKTSINDLVDHLGIHRRSLYDTFGDKHQLFLKAIERYNEYLNGQFQSGITRADSAKQAIRFLFDFMIEGTDDKPPGCLLVNMAVELAPWDPEVDAKTVQSFDKVEKLLADLIQRGLESGEFTSTRNASVLAEEMHNTMLGLRVLARTSTDKEKLHRIAGSAMSMLDI
ncbi:TetR/AcrR family transcriptional regulator [Paenibacillus chondroitinus]|uniref:TetR/AcrR family transcriptional regulator n=1 Tax=Paenibacillus chondroitinus TaxID=59842 RepID=A0ABU6DK34_9BACL|nr:MULTISPECIES: TetR/AcrR family transcriptional regulator [Paenibacillus]MCY9660672.1 TetR/AcrR family transcriptional regulator [Paenibacillus anseongense]MEB4798148.1 TetR/AcrR family transcriptional regulator [Paenibacillus chondroitinus]